MKRHHSLLLSTLLAATLTTPLLAAPASPTPPVIAQFFGIWTDPGQTWDQKFRSDTPFTKLNRLYVAFGKIVPTSRGKHFTIAFDGSEANALAIINRMRAVNPAAELFLSVGGDGTSQSYGGASNDPDFPANVAAFLKQYGFTGLDVDWEETLDRVTLNRLLTMLSQTLHPLHMKLTLDVWPWVTSAYDMPVMSATLDQINIMSYGTGIALSSVAPGFIAAGFPANKIIGGIESEYNFNQFGGTVDTLGSNGTIAAKAAYARGMGLAGMMEWRLDNDYATAANPQYPTYQAAEALWTDMSSA